MAAGLDFDIRDEAGFKEILSPEAKLEKLATNMKFTEGPVWVTSTNGGFLVFSDIPSDELKKWSEQGGLTTFRKPSFNANGNTVNRQNRIVTCEHSGRRVSMLEINGELRTLVDRFDGRKFNSPNDVAVKSDGTVWFTDPDYGRNPREYEGCFVFRFDPGTKSLTVLAKDFDKPNGICFSPDEKKLYIADSGKPRHIRVFDVPQDGRITGGGVFCQIDKGVPDGIRCDAKGRVWSSAGDGVHIFSPAGKLIGKILVPETPANLCFGGRHGKTLFITARTSLYSIPLKVKGGR